MAYRKESLLTSYREILELRSQAKTYPSVFYSLWSREVVVSRLPQVNEPLRVEDGTIAR